MRVPHSVRSLYQEYYPIAELLKKAVDDRVKAHKLGRVLN